MSLLKHVDSVHVRTRTAVRTLGYRTYYRLAGANYEREILARRNRTPVGTFRCYEPLNRHGSDPMLADVASHCRPTDVVYDVGANVGIYALALTTESPERSVVAFEPSPLAVERLRTNVRRNDLDARIDVRSCGLGAETGERPFYVSTYPECSAFDRESATRWGADVAAVRSVPIRRLDGLVLEDEVPPPDVVKIDVEGTAPDVLRGGRETLDRHRPALFVEVHQDGLDRDVPGALREILEELAYTVREHDSGAYWQCDPE